MCSVLFFEIKSGLSINWPYVIPLAHASSESFAKTKKKTFLMPFNWPFHYFGWHFFHIVTAITTNGTFALTLTQADDMFCEKIKTEFRTTKQRSSCWLKIVIYMEYSEDRSSFNRSKNVLNFQPQHMPYYTACVPARAEGDHMMRRIWNACVIRMIWIVNLNGRASMIFNTVFIALSGITGAWF